MVKRKAPSGSDSDASYRPPGKRNRASKSKFASRGKPKASRPKPDVKRRHEKGAKGSSSLDWSGSSISNGAAGIMHPSNGPEGVRARLQKMIDKGGELGKGAKKRLEEWEKIQAEPYTKSSDGDSRTPPKNLKRKQSKKEALDGHGSDAELSESSTSDSSEEEVTKPRPRKYGRLMPITPVRPKRVEIAGWHDNNAGLDSESEDEDPVEKERKKKELEASLAEYSKSHITWTEANERHRIRIQEWADSLGPDAWPDKVMADPFNPWVLDSEDEE